MVYFMVCLITLFYIQYAQLPFFFGLRWSPEDTKKLAEIDEDFNNWSVLCLTLPDILCIPVF